MSMRRRAASGLVLLGSVILALARFLTPGDAPPPSTAPASTSSPATSPREEHAREAPAAPSSARTASSRGTLDESALAGLHDAALAEQIRRVVASLDRDGRPPQGVARGGRRGGARGVFQNAEGRLPREAPGYYAESDVWPRAPGGRGALRLIFGREGQVWFSPDHYRTFTRLR